MNFLPPEVDGVFTLEVWMAFCLIFKNNIWGLGDTSSVSRMNSRSGKLPSRNIRISTVLSIECLLSSLCVFNDDGNTLSSSNAG